MESADVSTVLHPARLFHTGLVVADIDAAMAELSASLGIIWKGGWPATHQLHYFGADHEVELRIAFGRPGPPYIELIEAKPDTIWPLESSGLHHLCYWSPEPRVAAQSLLANGYDRILGAIDSDGGYFVGPSGLRVEILTPEYHQRLVAWIERGPRS